MGNGNATIVGIAAWKWAAGALVAVVLIAVAYFLPVKMWTEDFQRWIEASGPLGWIVFAGVYIAATVLLIPASVLTLVAGLAFGLTLGFPLVVVSATIGATLAFLVARHLVHDHVDKYVAGRPKLKAVKAAVSESGWKIVVLLRLSPVVPFNLQNYFYGVTDVRLAEYIWATFVGIMPGTLVYIYLGSVGKAATGESGGPLQWTFFVVGLIATVVVAYLVTRKAGAKLREHGVGNIQ